jgi:ribosomal-protein-serine acetyltransferase
MFSWRVDGDLELRALSEADSQALYELVDASRADLRTWLGWVDRTRAVTHVAAVTRNAARNLAKGTQIVAGVWTAGTLVGVIDLRMRPDQAHGEIGYWLVPAARGRGLITRAARVLVDHGFRERGLRRIEIRSATANAASRAVPERLGFTLEGTMPAAEWVNDHFNDLAVYAIRREDWERNGSPLGGSSLDGSPVDSSPLDGQSSWSRGD